MATLFTGVATELGLQVALHPYDNSLGRAACIVVGVAYPAYATLRTLETAQSEPSPSFQSIKGLNKWLKYWSVFGTITVAEALLKNVVPWVPYYHAIKVALLLWMQLPRFEGAIRLHRDVLAKRLGQIRPVVDQALDFVAALYASPVVTALESKLQAVSAHVPLLEWFMRGPDGKKLGK